MPEGDAKSLYVVDWTAMVNAQNGPVQGQM